MRGKKAKQIRREIYGSDYSPRDRQYKRVGRHMTTMINIGKRMQYLLTKKGRV